MSKLLGLKQLCNIIYAPENFDHYSTGELKERLRQETNEQDDIWRESGCTDYSIYSSKNYLAELLTGYYACSRPGMTAMLKFLQEREPRKWANFSYFDDYPGIGLSTLHLAAEDLDVSIRHDVKEQLKIFKKLFNAHNFDMPYNDVKLEQQYDVVISFEIIEHITEPLPYAKKLDELLLPGGYLVESSGFGMPKDGPLAGHFSEYTYEGKIVPAKSMGRKISAYRLKELGYVLLFTGWNGKPRIWQKPLQKSGRQRKIKQ